MGEVSEGFKNDVSPRGSHFSLLPWGEGLRLLVSRISGGSNGWGMWDSFSRMSRNRVKSCEATRSSLARKLLLLLLLLSNKLFKKLSQKLLVVCKHETNKKLEKLQCPEGYSRKALKMLSHL